ncbi:MAG: thiol-disulfide oxidoreductase DCC family protein [Solirubrobacteraceae bacterium]
MTPSGPANTSAWIVIYDADCGFCRWSLALLLGADRRRRLRPLALGTPEADALLFDVPAEQRAASWHLVSPDGSRKSAGSAAPRLLALLPGGRVPAGLLARAPALTDRAYDGVASHRSTLSRWLTSRAKRRATVKIARREAKPR